MDPDFQDVVDDPDTPFDESTIGDYLPAYQKLICNADGSVTQNQVSTLLQSHFCAKLGF